MGLYVTVLLLLIAVIRRATKKRRCFMTIVFVHFYFFFFYFSAERPRRRRSSQSRKVSVVRVSEMMTLESKPKSVGGARVRDDDARVKAEKRRCSVRRFPGSKSLRKTRARAREGGPRVAQKVKIRCFTKLRR
jgi:hypothetical protein